MKTFLLKSTNLSNVSVLRLLTFIPLLYLQNIYLQIGCSEVNKKSILVWSHETLVVTVIESLGAA